MARAQVDSHADDSVSLGGQVEPYFTAAPDLTHNHRQRRNRLAIPARNLISALPQVTQGESRVESAVRAQVAEQSLLAAAYLAQPCEIEMRVCIRRGKFDAPLVGERCFVDQTCNCPSFDNR